MTSATKSMYRVTIQARGFGNVTIDRPGYSPTEVMDNIGNWTVYVNTATREANFVGGFGIWGMACPEWSILGAVKVKGTGVSIKSGDTIKFFMPRTMGVVKSSEVIKVGRAYVYVTVLGQTIKVHKSSIISD